MKKPREAGHSGFHVDDDARPRNVRLDEAHHALTIKGSAREHCEKPFCLRSIASFIIAARERPARLQAFWRTRRAFKSFVFAEAFLGIFATQLNFCWAMETSKQVWHFDVHQWLETCFRVSLQGDTRRELDSDYGDSRDSFHDQDRRLRNRMCRPRTPTPVQTHFRR